LNVARFPATVGRGGDGALSQEKAVDAPDDLTYERFEQMAERVIDAPPDELRRMHPLVRGLLEQAARLNELCPEAGSEIDAGSLSETFTGEDR